MELFLSHSTTHIQNVFCVGVQYLFSYRNNVKLQKVKLITIITDYVCHDFEHVRSQARTKSVYDFQLIIHILRSSTLIRFFVQKKRLMGKVLKYQSQT